MGRIWKHKEFLSEYAPVSKFNQSEVTKNITYFQLNQLSFELI